MAPLSPRERNLVLRKRFLTNEQQRAKRVEAPTHILLNRDEATLRITGRDGILERPRDFQEPTGIFKGFSIFEKNFY